MMQSVRTALLCCLLPVLTGQTATAQQESTSPQPDPEQWAAILLDGRKVGFTSVRKTRRDGRIVTRQDMGLDLKRSGTAVSVRAGTVFYETSDGKPIGFEAVRKMGATPQQVNGTITPQGELKLVLQVPGGSTTRTVPWPDGALMPHGLELLQKRKGLREGTTYSALAFDPDTYQAMKSTTVVGSRDTVDLLGRSAKLTEITDTFTAPLAGQITVTSYVDEDFNVLRTTLPLLGMTLDVVACDKAYALSPASTELDFLTKMTLASPGPIDRSAPVLTYVLEPTGEDTKLTFPETDGQSVRQRDGTWLVTVHRPKNNGTGTRPYEGKDADAKRWLKSSKYVQSDEETIRELASQAVGEEERDLHAARAIEQFVAEYVTKKDLSVGYASAVEVARSRQGDCTEHAVLAAALCRAAGIPARVVTGLAYVERWGGREDLFIPHAWVEVLVGPDAKRWVSLDAALRRPGSPGVGRIVLGIGDGYPSDYFGLAQTLGNFTIAKVLAKP